MKKRDLPVLGVYSAASEIAIVERALTSGRAAIIPTEPTASGIVGRRWGADAGARIHTTIALFFFTSLRT